MAAAVTGSVLAGPAEAQSPRAGTIEIGVFGQWTRFDENAGRPNAVPEDGFGYGGRLGFFFTPAFQLEADGYYSPQDRDPDATFCCTGARPTEVDASGLALRLNYNFPLARAMQLVVGAGGVDAVGSHTLANVLSMTSYGGAVAACAMKPSRARACTLRSSVARLAGRASSKVSASAAAPVCSSRMAM